MFRSVCLLTLLGLPVAVQQAGADEVLRANTEHRGPLPEEMRRDLERLMPCNAHRIKRQEETLDVAKRRFNLSLVTGRNDP